MSSRTFTITDPAGIHARPASQLVAAASKFNSTINVTYKDKTVNLKSILGIMSLGIPSGSEITISADGEDADQSIESIAASMSAEGLI